MFDKEQNSKFRSNLKANRALYITAISILAVLIMIVAIVAANNRSKKTEDPTVTTPPVQTDDTGNDSSKDPVKDVSGKLPSFTLPLTGKLFKEHDEDMQVFSQTMEDLRVHLGVDILANEGDPVYASADGTVTQIWEDVRMGQCVAVKHNGNAVSIYKNLSETLPDGIKEGASVKSGQQIGSVGSTAMVEISDEPHLHYEMTVDGVAVDPLDYFSSTDVASLGTDTSFEDNEK